MNLLQSFMGCMYPGIIRTESIESTDSASNHPDCRVQVSHIDQRENEVSRGELQLTDRDLIYYRNSSFPTRWPLEFIRRWGYSDQDNRFCFEVGRKCPTGENIYGFRLSRGTEFVERFRQGMGKVPKYENSDRNDSQQNEILMNNRLNRFSASQQQTFSTPDDTMTQRNQQVPHPIPSESNELVKKTKRDAATSTDNQAINQSDLLDDSQPRPLSYAHIDLYKSEAVVEAARTHAANRDKEHQKLLRN